MRLNRADILIAALGIVALIVSFGVATDPSMRDLWLNLAASIATSVFFFFLLVWIPFQRRRARIRKSTITHYTQFKVQVVGLLLHASHKGWTDDEREKLAHDPAAFTAYFSEDETGSGMRWYEVLNGLDDYYVGQIATQLELLRMEIQFALNALDIEDDDLFEFMKRLAQICFTMSKRSSADDEVKTWGKFLWHIYSDWDPHVGEVSHDRILVMLQRI